MTFVWWTFIGMSLADHDLTSRTKDLTPRSYFLRTSSSTNHQSLWLRLLCLLLALCHPLQQPYSIYLWWLRYDDGHATWDPIIPTAFRDPSSVIAAPTIISDLHRRATTGPLKDAGSSLINLFLTVIVKDVFSQSGWAGLIWKTHSNSLSPKAFGQLTVQYINVNLTL